MSMWLSDINIDKSNAVILAVVGGIILIIVLVAIAKGGKSLAWIIWLIISAIVGYLYISAKILRK